MTTWWVTVRIDATRTCDELVVARSQWSAGWLYRVLHPEAVVLMVRPAR